jgi:YVTN family beta-propeller protein
MKPSPLSRPRVLSLFAVAFGAAAVLAGNQVKPTNHGGAVPRVLPHTPPRAPQALFRANCATCHGQFAGGGTSWIDPSYPAPPIATTSPAFIKGIARAGRIAAMPAFPPQEISDEELNLLANYISGQPATYVADPPFNTTVQLLDEDPWFSPMQLTISAGQTVRFLNAGKTYHPVLDQDWLDTGGFQGQSSGSLGPNGVFYRTFPSNGEFDVFCGQHHDMRCEIHVGQGFTPPTYSVDSPMATPATAGVGEIWVCCQFQDYPSKPKDGVVQVINAATWTVANTIPVGNNPHDIRFGASNAQALVTNWFDATVTRINATTKTVIDDCVGGAVPAHVTTDPSNQYWFVTVEGSKYIQRFDQAPGFNAPCGGGTMATQAALISGYGPHGIAYANGKVYTANLLDSTFSIVNASTLLEITRLPAGMCPMGAATNSAGTVGATANMMGMSVSMFDLATPTAVREIPVSDEAHELAFTPDSTKILVSNGAQVTVIDVAKAMDVINFPNPASAIVANIATGKGAHGIAFGAKSGGGTYAYVTNQFENYISVIDLGTLTRVGDVALTTTTTGKVTLAGATDTGGNGIAVR